MNISLGTWNAHNSFDSTFMGDAIEKVKQMDSDILYIGEFAENLPSPSEFQQQATETLATELGYTNYNIADYSDARNLHLMSMWSRLESSTPAGVIFHGNRNTINTTLADSGFGVAGVHFDDLDEVQRMASVESVLGSLPEQFAIMGDFNLMNPDDLKSKFPRFLSRFTDGVEFNGHYNDDSKIQRITGKVLRVCGMSKREFYEEFSKKGIKTANVDHKSTVGTTPLSFTIDHILVSEGLGVESFKRLSRKNTSGQNISDHNPITADVTF